MDFAVLAPLEKDIRTLAQNASDLRALMRVGKFVYENYIQPNSDIGGNARLFEGDLGRFCPNCVGNLKGQFVAYDYFKDVAEALNKAQKKSDLEAEALHFLVKCHKGFEFQDRCGLPQDGNSKIWFTRLHQKYAKSDWAKKTPYYY